MNKLSIHFFTTLLLLCFISTSPLQAQEELNRETGIRFSGLNNFGMVYKKKKEENKYRRIRLGVADIGFSHNQGTQAFNLRANMAIGVEKRKAINSKFHFIHGLEFLGSLNLSASENSGSVNLLPGMGFVIGFQYAIAQSFYVSVETIPSVRASFSIDEDGFRDAIAIDAGFNSQAASLNLIYQFHSRKEKS